MEAVTEHLFEYGPLGIIAVVMLYGIMRMADKLDKAYQRIDELQETRVTESRATVEAVHAAEKAMEKLTETIERRG